MLIIGCYFEVSKCASGNDSPSWDIHTHTIVWCQTHFITYPIVSCRCVHICTLTQHEPTESIFAWSNHCSIITMQFMCVCVIWSFAHIYFASQSSIQKVHICWLSILTCCSVFLSHLNPRKPLLINGTLTSINVLLSVIVHCM